MDLPKMLIELRREREQIEQVITSLEKLILDRDHKRRRGRPPKWLSEARKLSGTKPNDKVTRS